MSGDYRALVDVSEEALDLLDSHLQAAAKQCVRFAELIAEKRKLPSDLNEANKVILDKLAEIRAINGLLSLGFAEIEFTKAPDFAASYQNGRFGIEVTRLGSSEGKRSQAWDSRKDFGGGSSIGWMSQYGAVTNALEEAIYREIEGKSAQLKVSGNPGIVWISLGRDYFMARKYELEGIGAARNLQLTMRSAVERVMDSISTTGLYRHISHAVLSPGRDLVDVVVPPLRSLGGVPCD